MHRPPHPPSSITHFSGMFDAGQSRDAIKTDPSSLLMLNYLMAGSQLGSLSPKMWTIRRPEVVCTLLVCYASPLNLPESRERRRE
jgi:hypothetical protein